MNYRIRNTEYFVGTTKQGKKTVVCKLYCYPYDNVASSDCIESVLYDCVEGYDCWEPKVFVGKAVLAAGDEFNEETGKRIAESKAKKSLFNSMMKTNLKMSQEFQRLADEHSKVSQTNLNWWLDEDKHYKELAEIPEEDE